MGRYVHVGVYLAIKVRKIELIAQTTGCQDHGKHYGNFCGICGSPAGLYTIKHERYPSLDEIIGGITADDFAIGEDYIQDDTLLVMGEDPDIGDRLGDEADRGIEITAAEIEKCLLAFQTRYADALDHIRRQPSVVSVDVRFGVLNYWM